MVLIRAKLNLVKEELLNCSKLASWIAIGVGSLVVLGWAYNVELLTKVRSGWTPMVFNSAVCFVLAGISLRLMHKNRLSPLLALIFGLVALLSGAQYFLTMDFGIDQFLFHYQQTNTKSYHPGRMAINTSVCFVLLAIGIIIAQSASAVGILISQLAALIVNVVSLIALIGYLYGTFGLYGINGYSSMAIHTALLFFILSVGILAIFPDRGLTRLVGRDPQTARLGMKFLLVVLSIPVFFGWLWLQGQERGIFNLQFGVSVMVVFNLLFLAAIVWLFIDKLCAVSSQRNDALKTVSELNSNLEDKIKSRTESLEKMIGLLQTANDRFNSVMSTASDAIICVNRNGEIVLWNYAAEEMFGYRINEIAAKPLTLLIPPRFYEAHVKAFARAVQSLASPTLRRPTELIAVKKDGSEFPIELSLSSWDASGQKYFTGVIRDITSRKQAEKKIEEQQKTMIQLSRNQAFGQLAGGLAHEMNTPLAVIYLQVPRIRSDILENKMDKAMSSLSSIETMAQRISGIVNRLMLFSQESNESEPAIVNVNDLVDQALGFCHEKFKNEHITLKVESTDSLLTVKCKGTDLTQAILNLLLNSFDAAKGTKDPWIHVKLGRRGRSVEVSVTDSGRGIPAEIQQRIMEPFFTTKDVGAGMGLGLSVTKGIIESHKGQISLDKESPNTKFILEVPYEKGEENAF